MPYYDFLIKRCLLQFFYTELGVSKKHRRAQEQIPQQKIFHLKAQAQIPQPNFASCAILRGYFL